jgi:hypothetical protein
MSRVYYYVHIICTIIFTFGILFKQNKLYHKYLTLYFTVSIVVI